ncbi:MAG TPA: hypothetical protein VMV22_12040, partial [Acidimicrobiales bacterium]|nr:hypothetical protein [Acidimicrobiales bacterium]
TDIVGYPIFADFALNRYFDAFYLLGLALPLLAVVLYAVLPVGRPRRAAAAARVRIRPLALVAPRSEAEAVSGTTAGPATAAPAGGVSGDDVAPVSDGAASERALAVTAALRRGARVAVPALAVGLCVGVGDSGHGRHLSAWGIAAGAVYAVAVPAVARLLGRGGAPGDRVRLLAAVNGGAGLIVLPSLYVVSRSTSVLVESGHRVHDYPWLPLWLVLPVLAVAALWYGRRLRRADSTDEVVGVEGSVLTYVVAPSLLFVLIASLTGPLDTTFFAFDDAQSFTGAALTFGHGLFPWRDLYVIHGIFADILGGQLGMSVFGPSRWGSTAGVTMFLIPLLWVSLYLFTAYFARRNRLLATGFVVVTALWLTSGRLAGAGMILGRDVQSFASGCFRFAFLPIVLLVFDQTVRRRSRGWCAGLMAALAVQAIVVPESGLMAAGVLATLVAFEWLGRDPADGWAGSMMRTRWCAGFGALLVMAWVVFLVATGSLRGFVDYYLIFGPGHALSGTVPATWIGTNLGYTVELVVPVVLLTLTIVRAAYLVHVRRPWDSRDWVMVAAASFVALYFQKVLARADGAHVAEVFTVSLPLVLLWIVLASEALDDTVRRAMRGDGSGHIRRSADGPGNAGGIGRSRGVLSGVRRPATLVVVVALVALAPAPLGTVRDLPGEYHPTAATTPVLPRLGYAKSGVVDVTMVHDLDAVLRRYAGDRGAVFDFGDEPGLLYFLLGRVPGTRFFHVSMADTSFAQRQLVSDLTRSRPRVVVFYGLGMGLPAWDGIQAWVRHYAVSEYLLDNYRPLADVDGQFVMVRADLAATAPPLPALKGPVTTSDPYLSLPTCDWGFAPNFLARSASLSSSPGLTLRTHVVATSVVSLSGWSFDARRALPPVRVLAARDGRQVGSVVPNGVRLDALRRFTATGILRSGFTMDLLARSAGPVALYGLNPDGTVSPLAPLSSAPSTLVVRGGDQPVTTSDGVVHAVSTESVGSVGAALVHEQIVALDVPPGSDLAGYHWLELSAPRHVGPGAYSVSDGIDQSPGAISFRALLRAGSHLFVQVGSCPQWRSFTAPGLTLLARGGRGSPPSVRLVR